MLFIANLAFSQEDAVNKAATLLQSKNYSEAIPLLDAAVKHNKTSMDAKAWHYRGFAYKDKYNATKDTNDRKVVVESLLKSMELDTKDEFKATSMQLLKYISTAVYNDAVNALNNQNYAMAHSYYEQYVSLLQKTSPSEITSEIIFYAGYTAYMAHDMNPAKTYFEKAREMNHPDPLLYEFLGKEYWELGERDKSIEALEEGTSKYPHNKDLVLLEIDYLLKMGNSVKATEKLDQAIKLDPTNIDLKVLLAQLYEMQAKFDKGRAAELTEKARDSYKRVLVQDPTHHKANYNLATSYYNEGVNKMNNMNDDDDDLFALMDVQDECINLFKEALPYMEKAHQLDPKNKDTLVGLSGIYFSLNYADKANKVQEQISALEQKGK